MAKTRISSDFEQYEMKHQSAVQEAKEAENTMGGISLPIGAMGTAVVTDMTATKTKPSTANPNGMPMITFTATVTEPVEFQGRKLTKRYLLGDSKKKNGEPITFAQKLGWCLNELENAGLPREIRLKQTADIIDWWLAENRLVSYHVQADQYDSSGKKVLFGLPGSNVAPDLSGMAGAPGGKKTVTYNGTVWEVVSENGDELVIKSEAGREREVKRSEVVFPE